VFGDVSKGRINKIYILCYVQIFCTMSHFFTPEDGESTFFQNVGTYLSLHNDVTTQNNIVISEESILASCKVGFLHLTNEPK
jgi:hypothetical protein